MLMKPNLQATEGSGNFHLPFESTINESDVLQTPKNTSTPRNSEPDIRSTSAGPRLSLFSQLREKLEKDVSVDEAVSEFKEKSLGISNGNLGDSDMFMPAEDVASRLRADELSWKRKHEFPPNSFNEGLNESKEVPRMSIGEFFQQGSRNISELRAKSPGPTDPVPLVDASVLSSTSNTSMHLKEKTNLSCKSLSESAILQIIAEAQSSPNALANLFCKTNLKTKKGSYRDSSDIFSLPVSQDASYTTSFSDNEAVKVAVIENKENVRPHIEEINQNPPKVATAELSSQTHVRGQEEKVACPSPPPSRTSTRSSSCLTNFPDGKLPIESTVGELVWGCVKVDRCVTKQFMLRNKTSKTLRLQCSLSSYEFKIRKDIRSDSDHLSACKFVLHGHESRQLIVSFIPTKVGAAVDELVFAPLQSNLPTVKKQCVRLWGYGGYSSTEYHNVSRDNTGKYWLSLGRMDNRTLMEQSFSIKNTGNLPSFVYFQVSQTQFKQTLTFTSLTVEPKLMVLLPNESKTVNISYIPNARDCKVLKQNLNVVSVMDIGKLNIVSGPEVNRARLRRLKRKRIDKDQTVDDLTKALAEKIPGEVFPSDVSLFKELPNAIPDILETLNTDEMVITVEQDPNQTLVAEYPEDSVIYQSLCQDNTVLNDDMSVLSTKSCRLEPPLIVLSSPSKLEDCLFLTSDASDVLHFKVTSNTPDLQIFPSVGNINPGETTELHIKLSVNSSESYFKVSVYVDCEVFESEVKVLRASRGPRRHFLD
ncbi:uncharacterized protein LOC126744519 isoform X2 [Anthonomus grandis grandis]|nr:uncharacterized protein LOC126744519 isoform X2 [Anthonomus grandis grandis]